MKNYCCLLMVGTTVLGIYAVILLSIFFFNSMEYNSLFNNVVTLERQIRDETMQAMSNLNHMTAETSDFMNQNPDFFQSIKKGIEAFISMSNSDLPFDKLASILEWLNQHRSEFDNAIRQGVSITNALSDLLNKDKKFEIRF
jgi:ABC-type transporter Mla subunit MlaD